MFVKVLQVDVSGASPEIPEILLVTSSKVVEIVPTIVVVVVRLLTVFSNVATILDSTVVVPLILAVASPRKLSTPPETPAPTLPLISEVVSAKLPTIVPAIVVVPVIEDVVEANVLEIVAKIVVVP